VCVRATTVCAMSVARGQPVRKGMQIVLNHLPTENETLHSGLREDVVT
jgi:hypothetical protein